jgi:hypothetical protein
MTRIVCYGAIIAVAVLFALPAAAQETESGTPASPAIYSKTNAAASTQLAAWPGYYYYGVYYGSARWRYQPYYTYYGSPWWDYGVYYTPYAYAWPTYGYGYGYGYPSYSWPHYGAYGYTYYGPVTYGY